MSKMSRDKGRKAEREVEVAFQEAGFSTDRNIGGRKQVAGDIAVEGLAVEGLAVEVRRRERLDVPGWSVVHEDSTPSHLTPVLCWRRSREPWRVSLPLSDFLDLLKEARS